MTYGFDGFLARFGVYGGVYFYQRCHVACQHTFHIKYWIRLIQFHQMSLYHFLSSFFLPAKIMLFVRITKFIGGFSGGTVPISQYPSFLKPA